MMEFRTLGGVELRGPGGDSLQALAAQPRRLALLAYLCVATPRGFHRRDALLALFWPDSDHAHARTALRNAVHFLRRSLGADTVNARGDEEIAVDSQQLWCDAVAFDNAVEEGRVEEAVRLYRGDFLAGFFIREAPEWERWLEDERARFRSNAARMAGMVAELSETDRNITAAVSWARRAVELTGDDERAFRRLLELFERVNDRAGALNAYDAFARRMRAEYGSEPAPETRAIVDRIRAMSGVATKRRVSSAATHEELSSTSIPSEGVAFPATPSYSLELEQKRGFRPPSLVSRERLFRLARSPLGIVAAAALVVGTAAAISLARNEPPARQPVSPYRVAVFPFRILGDTSWAFLHDGSMDLLSGALDGDGDLRRVDPAALTSRMRREGASEVDPGLARRISAELGAGRYVLGTVVGERERASISASVYETERDAEPLATARAATERDSLSYRFISLARDLVRDQKLGEGGRLSPIRSIHALSFAAEKAFFSGEAMFRRGVYDSAGRMYEQAVQADSTFAIAWYRLSLARSLGAEGSILESIDAAMRHRARLAERDRLLVESNEASLRGKGKLAEDRALAAVTAYPDEVEAWSTLGAVRWWYAWQLGRSPITARPAFERALRLDPDYRTPLHMLHALSLYERRYADAQALARRAYSPQGPLAFNLLSAKAVSAFATKDTIAERAVVAELGESGEYVIFQSAAFVASYTDNLAGARKIAELMIDSSTRSPAARARGHVMLGLIEIAGGARDFARREFARAATFDEPLALTYEGIIAAIPQFGFAPTDVRAIRENVRRWRPAKRERMELPWLATPDELSPRIRDYVLGLLAARLSEDERALEYADVLAAANDAEDNAKLLPDLALEIRALVSARSGDSSASLATLAKADLGINYHYQVATPLHERPVGRFLRAELLHSLGRDAEALGWYASLTSLSMTEFVLLAPAYLRIGEIHERAGNRAQALEYYSRFVSRWQNCDSSLRPLLVDARRRIARLSNGAGHVE